MVEPPEAIEAGEHFRFFSEVTPVCSSEETCAVPAGEQVSLVASAPRFGLLFVGQGGVLQVYSTVSLSQSPTTSIPVCSVWCGGRITHLSRTCDSLTLLVTAIWPDDIPHILFFDVRTMAQQGVRLAPYLQCCGSNLSGSRLTALMPSPTDPGCVALCTSTGDLTVLSISENSVSYNTKKGIGAGAVGWSAKGKQLSVGCSNGSLALFKPDLTPVRVIAAPPSLPYNPAPITALVWFTNTEFFVCYQQENVPILVYVNGPKDKPAQYLSYDDVCYSSEGSTPQYYNLCFVPEWNQLFVMSSGGVEMATLIKCDGGGWAQLFLDEGHRAEMHFVNVTQETYPLGVALDFASTKTFPLKEDQSEGPFPIFYTLSTGGELNIFHMSNKLPGATDLCSAYPVERIPAAISVRTPQQYGMNIVIPHQPASVAGPQAASLFGGAAAVSAGSAFSSVIVSSSAVAPPFSSFGGVSVSAAVSSASAVPGTGGVGGLFGNLAPPQSGSLFGGMMATSTTTSTPAASSSSLFSLKLSAPSSSLFGGKPSVSGSSLFGGSTAGPSMFGSSASNSAATSSGSIFGSTAVSTPLAITNSGTPLSSYYSPTTTTTATCSIFGGSVGTTSYVPSTQTFSAQVVTSSDTKVPGIGSGNLVPSSTSFSQGMAFNFSAPGSGSVVGSNLQGSVAASSGTFLATSAGIGASQSSSSPLTSTTPAASTSRNRIAASDGGSPVPQLGPRAGIDALPPPAYNINASSLPGNGQSPKTGMSSGPNSARQTPVREVAKARTAQQDKALMAQITEEQDRFNKELGEHFRISEQCEYKGGWEESMRSVQSVLSNTEESLVQHRKQSRELSDAVAELHTALLEFYSGYEDAKATCNRINDPDQAYLTEWRGLDRCSERRLQELRSKLHYIQSELSYANATLDTIASNRLNKQNNARNRRVGGGGGVSGGGSEDVYRTVLLTHKARLACERQLDHLAEKMGSLSVVPGHTLRTRGAPNTLRSSEGKYGISNDSLLVSYSEDNKENVSSNSTVSTLTPAKQEKLWDLLQQRKTTPVRRSGRPAYSPSVDSLSSPVNRSRLTGCATLVSASQLFAAAPSPGLSALHKPQRHHDPLPQAPPASSLPSTPVQGLSLNTPDRSLLMSMSSFGPPAKCSTPAAESSPPATSQTGLKLGGGVLREQLDANLIQSKPTGLNLNEDHKVFSNWQVPTSSIVSAFQASSVAPSFPASSVLKTEVGQQEFSTPKSAGAATPKYEDITPPGTPDIPSDAAATADEASSVPKAPTNPLSALSSLVGKVPGMSTTGTVPAQGFFSATTQSSSLFAAIPPGSAAVEPTQVSGIMSGKPFNGFSSNSSVSVASSTNSFGSSSGSAFAANAKAFTLLPRPESPATSSGGDPPATTSSAFGFGSSSFSFNTATTATATSSSSAQTLTSSSAVSCTDGASSSKAVGGSSLFSAPVTSSVGSLFSSLPKTTGSFPFGSTVSAATTSTNSLFAGSPATSQPSLFGTGKGLFGSSEPAVIKSELVTTTSSFPSFSVATAVKAEPLAATTSSTLSSGASYSTVSSTINVPSEKLSVLTSSLPTPSTESIAVSWTPASSVSPSGGLFSLATASAASASPSLFGALSKNSAITITAVTTSAHSSAPTVSTLTITPSPAIVVPSFAQPTSATPSPASTQSSGSLTSSLFGQTSSSVSGTATIIAPSSQATSLGSLFVAPTSGGSLFGGAPTATNTTSVFGGASSLPFGTLASAGTGSIFANSSVTGSVSGAPATSGSSIFAASTTTSGASFGAPVTTSSVFGGLLVTSGSSAFGAPASTASPFASSSSVFGAPAAASSGTSLFGGQPPTSGSSTSVFGSGSPFGAVAKPAVSGGSLFGGSTSGGSVFGGGNGSASISASVFGGAATFGSSVASAFGGGSNAVAGTVFGGGDNSGASVSSVFGSNAAAPGNSSSSVFGGAASNPAASGGSIFGGSGFSATGQASSSVFGVAPSVDAGGNSVFGSSSSSSAFGTSSGFGNNSAGGTSLFGNSNSMFTGLGGKPSSPTNKNVFGVSTGAVKPQTDLFGGPASSGSGVASPSLFGGSSAAAQARPSPAFGSAAAFGSPPKFGSAPAFGSPPAFGSTGGSAFGGGSVFGGATAPTGGASLFGGGSSGGGGGFSSFANSSNTATFGGLAANSDSSSGFGAPTAESNASVFPKANTGSSSFSSWR